MLIAKLTISYDRGLARNEEKDLEKSADGIEGKVAVRRGSVTADGKVIRGLGMHFRSEQDMLLAQERDKDAKRIYNEFRARFLATPLEGVYVVEKRGAAKAFIDGLSYRDDIKVYVTEFELTAPGELNSDELRAWGEKVRRQLQAVQLGRKKDIDEDGLNALVHLADCPVLAKETGKKIKELVEGVRCQKIDRVELKRSLGDLDIKIEQTTLAPRRAPKLVPAEVA